MKARISAFVVVGVILAASTARAHHSGTNFETKRITLTGTLAKLDWRNPHIEFSLDGKGDKGQAESWLIESQTPNFFAIRKVGKVDFQNAIGQTVTVEVSPDKDGSRFGQLRKITFPNGTMVVTR